MISAEELTEIQRAENERVPEGEKYDYEARLEELGISREAVAQFREESLHNAAMLLSTRMISPMEALQGNASYGLHVGILVGLELAERRERESTEAGH